MKPSLLVSKTLAVIPVAAALALAGCSSNVSEIAETSVDSEGQSSSSASAGSAQESSPSDSETSTEPSSSGELEVADGQLVAGESSQLGDYFNYTVYGMVQRENLLGEPMFCVEMDITSTNDRHMWPLTVGRLITPDGQTLLATGSYADDDLYNYIFEGSQAFTTVHGTICWDTPAVPGDYTVRFIEPGTTGPDILHDWRLRYEG